MNADAPHPPHPVVVRIERVATGMSVLAAVIFLIALYERFRA